jgi:outer membrane lipoprotein-sorting protein
MRKCVTLKKLVLCAFAIILLTSAQTYAENLADIVKSAQAKYAGYQKEVKDLTILQDTTMVTEQGNMPIQMKMFLKDPKFRAETKMNAQQGQAQGMPAMETTIIYDGKDIWMISPFMGKSKLPKGQENQYKDKSNWWAMISENAEVTGTEKIGNKNCYIITAKEKSTNPFSKIWIDKDTYAMAKAESKDPNGKIMTFNFSDFKDTKGWEMPYKTEMFMDGKLLSTSIIKSIDLNKNLSDDLFDAAKIQAKEFNMQDYVKTMQQQEK